MLGVDNLLWGLGFTLDRYIMQIDGLAYGACGFLIRRVGGSHGFEVDWAIIYDRAARTDFLVVTLNKCVAVDTLDDAFEAKLLFKLSYFCVEFVVLNLLLTHLVDVITELTIDISILCLVDETKNLKTFPEYAHVDSVRDEIIASHPWVEQEIDVSIYWADRGSWPGVS